MLPFAFVSAVSGAASLFLGAHQGMMEPITGALCALCFCGAVVMQTLDS
ncbi:MAG: hypothetical protein HY482_01125 [Candidatus Wildermuthbacteria bacterium]|nr:hypothetical protein [Candidatus Wildermuthbacteria bacterium]